MPDPGEQDEMKKVEVGGIGRGCELLLAAIMAICGCRGAALLLNPVKPRRRKMHFSVNRCTGEIPRFELFHENLEATEIHCSAVMEAKAAVIEHQRVVFSGSL